VTDSKSEFFFVCRLLAPHAGGVKDFTAGDRAIRADIGFRYEILPMLNAVLPA
jgi:hypothetical protein